MTKLISATILETVELIEAAANPKLSLRIKASPAIRQIYWCSFPEDTYIPEMGKERPVLVTSFRNTLKGHCLVLPISTDPQEGKSSEWAHKLSVKVDGKRDSWVVCNHLYTVSTVRLAPARVIPRLSVVEFEDILKRMYKWLPVPGGG